MNQLKCYSVKGLKENPNIILLHGYGANGQDLVGLAHYPALKKLNLNWYFLEAPLSPPELAAFGGRAWFNLTLSSFTQQMSSQNFSAFYNTKPKELEQSLNLINETLWSLNLEGTTYIGGFSQGAMMAANLFFNDLNTYAGLVALSGAPLQNKNWKEASDKKAFLSHGVQDAVLPFQCGKDFEKELKKQKLQLKTEWFQGGHEIPPQVLQNLANFLS